MHSGNTILDGRKFSFTMALFLRFVLFLIVSIKGLILPATPIVYLGEYEMLRSDLFYIRNWHAYIDFNTY